MPDLPQPVQPLLSEYTALINAALPDLLVGLYLHGSLALDAFNLGISDIDFIAIISRRCTPTDLERLRAVHAILTRRHPHLPMSGGYLQWDDMGGREDTVRPHPCIHDGIFHASGHHEINEVTWWVLKHHGIALIGPSPEKLPIVVDMPRLLTQMHQNMTSYWASYTTVPGRIAWLFTDYGVQWAILGILRQYYTFRERKITSKVGAGLYALNYLPTQWHQLIREAIQIREGAHRSSYRSRIWRAIWARSFLQLIILACNHKHDVV